MDLKSIVTNALSYVGGSGKNKAKNDISSLGHSAADFLRYGAKSRPLVQNWSETKMSDRDMYSGDSYAMIEKRANRAATLGKHYIFTTAEKHVMEAAKAKETTLKHPYIDLIKSSKEFTERRFWHDISTYIDLEGVYYLMAVRAVTSDKKGNPKVGEVQKFVMLNPYFVRRVVRESDGELGGYVETKNGMYREIPKEMIIEIKKLNPFNDDDNWSLADAAKDSQYTLKQANDYVKHSMNGNVNAPGILGTEAELDDPDFDNFINRVRNHEKGEPLFGNGTGAISWTPMQADLDKAALEKINAINLATLYSVGGVSDMLMGRQKSGTGREVSKTQKDEFTENSIMPQIEEIIDALNLDYRQYYPEWEKNKYEIELDNPLESDRESELKSLELREKELALRDSLIAKGFEPDLAAKYATGEISLEELGEPTLEPELSNEEAMAQAKRELGMSAVDETSDEPQEGDEMGGLSADEDIEARSMKDTIEGNNFTALNAFVESKKNEEKVEKFKKQLRALKKSEAKKASDDSGKVIEQEKDKKSKNPKKTPETKQENTKDTNATTLRVLNQKSSRDIPDLYDDLDIDMDKLGCIMMDTEKVPVVQYVEDGSNDLADASEMDYSNIPGEDVPHVTLLFGLLENGNIWKQKVDKVLEGWKLDTVKIEEVSFFDLGEKKVIVGLVEKTPELIDGHERLTLLPHINTFSEYKPHISLAYINKEADEQKWIGALGKKYNGQIIATKSINYGDLPEDGEDDGEDGEQDKPKSENSVHSHEKEAGNYDFLEKANNALSSDSRDALLLQQNDLQRAVAGLERDIVDKVVLALRSGDLYEAERLISQQEEEEFVAILTTVLIGFFVTLFPIYATQIIASRIAQLGQNASFGLNDDVRTYISKTAEKAARSHISTIITDIDKTFKTIQDQIVREQMLLLVQKEVDARNEDYLGELPQNPNPEDVKKAVEQGKFDKEEVHARAFQAARSGDSIDKISQALQQKHRELSQTRAKIIAQNESIRAFNVSQFEADIQFLDQTNLGKRAYKRLVTSGSGNSCAVCLMLEDKTRLNPIPFKSNFANLGTNLSATYKTESGKSAVLKVPIKYQAVRFGNVHVNCGCRYELLIKTDDGRFVEDVSELD